MKPDQAQLLRRVVLNDKEALDMMMTGQGQGLIALDARCASLVRIAALVSVDSDPSTFEWAVDLGVASGLDDAAIFDAVMLIAPVIGVAKLTSTLPRLMSALDIELVES
jgi:alkylhydroperoxidase/carboxymuconolactone decarboxylase family protein YurZ